MRDWIIWRNDGSAVRVKREAKPRSHKLWQVKRNTGSIANIFRNGIAREVVRPTEMSRAEFFRRLEPGSSVSEIDLSGCFDGWNLGHGVVEWRRM